MKHVQFKVFFDYSSHYAEPAPGGGVRWSTKPTVMSFETEAEYKAGLKAVKKLAGTLSLDDTAVVLLPWAGEAKPEKAPTPTRDIYPKLAECIRSEYDCLEKNVDAADRGASSYNLTRNMAIKEFCKKHPDFVFDDTDFWARFHI